MLERANPFDALVGQAGTTLDDLRENARVGSSSLRRQAQLLARRPDLRIEPLRGNVNTRLAKLDDGEFDAIMLACAGLERLGMGDRISQVLDPSTVLPAAAQGVVGIECLSGASDVVSAVGGLEHAATRTTTDAERAVAFRLQANCQSPVASYATLADDALHLTSLVAAADGSRVLREAISGSSSDAEALGLALADRLLEQGAGELLGDAET